MKNEGEYMSTTWRLRPIMTNEYIGIDHSRGSVDFSIIYIYKHFHFEVLNDLTTSSQTTQMTIMTPYQVLIN